MTDRESERLIISLLFINITILKNEFCASCFFGSLVQKLRF